MLLLLVFVLKSLLLLLSLSEHLRHMDTHFILLTRRIYDVHLSCFLVTDSDIWIIRRRNLLKALWILWWNKICQMKIDSLLRETQIALLCHRSWLSSWLCWWIWLSMIDLLLIEQTSWIPLSFSWFIDTAFICSILSNSSVCLLKS